MKTELELNRQKKRFLIADTNLQVDKFNKNGGKVQKAIIYLKTQYLKLKTTIRFQAIN